MDHVEEPVGRVRQWIEPVDEANIFELAPVSLWIEDLSGIKALLTRWSQEGMTSVGEYLSADVNRTIACQRAIRVLKVNKKTLTLYEADDLAHLVANFHHVISPEQTDAVVAEITGLWAGKLEFFNNTTNYTLSGRRLDIQLRGNLLPGHEESWSRVLVAVEDVTDLHATRRDTARSEAYARGLFEHSPVSLWVKDFSGIKPLFDELRRRDVHDLGAFMNGHPDFLERCMGAIHTIDVNRQTLNLYGVSGQTASWRHHSDLLRLNLRMDLRAQLIGLWMDELFQERETINHRLDGTEIHVQLQFSVLPGYQDDWSRVQVSRTDLTSRKSAEAHLQYLQNHDSLTRLHSRSFYNAELARLIEAGVDLVTIIVADLNGLKLTNDRHGHGKGDEMLRRAGEILAGAGLAPWPAARIGGDEFVILMAGADALQGRLLMATIQADIQAANHAWTDFPLSLSLGAATRQPEELLTTTVNRADACMYEAKRLHYTQAEHDRRYELT